MYNLKHKSYIVSHDRAGPPLWPRLPWHFPGHPSLGNRLPGPAGVDPKSWAGAVKCCHHIPINFIPFVHSGYHQYPGSQRAEKKGRVVACCWPNQRSLGRPHTVRGRTHSTHQKGTFGTACWLTRGEMVAPFSSWNTPPSHDVPAPGVSATHSKGHGPPRGE